jgi:DNA-binding CsgD family transcriptional regulator
VSILLERHGVCINRLEDIRTAADALAQQAREMGDFRISAVDNLASKQPMIDHEGDILAEKSWGWTGPDEQWWRNTRLALTSPVPRACRYESEPFWCNAQGFFTRQRNPYLEQIDLTDFAKRACMASAIVVPVHLPFGQIGAVSWAPRGKNADLSEIYESLGDELAILAQRFINGYSKVTRTRRMIPGDCQLTKREVECLRWAAIGKTDKEISMILSRSHATVRFHIKNAGEKLDTVNRSQTIFKAAQLGYLGLAA